MTNEQIQNYRNALTAYANVMNVSLSEAFDSTVTPDWVWAECALARKAARSRCSIADEDLLSLFAGETPEREAASKAKYNEIRALVCG